MALPKRFYVFADGSGRFSIRYPDVPDVSYQVPAGTWTEIAKVNVPPAPETVRAAYSALLRVGGNAL